MIRNSLDGGISNHRLSISPRGDLLGNEREIGDMVQKLDALSDDLFELSRVEGLSNTTRHFCDRTAIAVDFVASIASLRLPLVFSCWRAA